ncbi:TIGR04540 family protein [Clostridium sp. UBA4548]|uniref:TIGR04540 family protein n=1 Tax=Clostridium sp. UBA4548 TaxID=1946361 RepID=UPI0025C57004|nr:TIGR04540 family protein [Clostridium sp. UBA4548]
MRLTYKNPKELATAIKDLVDSYLDDVMEYEVLKERLKKLIEANKERVYKDGIMSLKIANVLGEERVNIVNKIIKEQE